jgi:hypothetical protein
MTITMQLVLIADGLEKKVNYPLIQMDIRVVQTSAQVAELKVLYPAATSHMKEQNPETSQTLTTQSRQWRHHENDVTCKQSSRQ